MFPKMDQEKVRTRFKHLFVCPEVLTVQHILDKHVSNNP